MRPAHSPSILDQTAPFPILLAPMVGVTHFVVRRAIQEYLPPGARSLWLTEMLSSRRIPYQERGQHIETRFDDADAGLCPQLLGNEESFIRDSIHRLRDWGARAIDINMGCPAKRALQHNYGVALLGDPTYAAEITALAVKHAGDLPVSVKLRASLDADPAPEFLHDFCRGIEAAGASWITLHPRTAAQKRRGDADWSQIQRVKGWLKIPVIGNGDVQTSADARRMFEETGCDRVMIGRALLAKPWMLREFGQGDGKDDGQAATPLEGHAAGAEYGRFLARVLALSREHYGEPSHESLGVRRFRFLVYHGSPYLEFGHTLYAAVKNADTYALLAERVRQFFAQPQKMSASTALRV